MVRSNKSITWLLTALSMIILWGFIASLALPLESRHIGLSISALIAGIIIYYYKYLIFSSSNVHKDLIIEYLTVNDIFECYKLSASISADYKDLHSRGKAKQDVDIIQEFKEISVKKSIKFERELLRNGICPGGCGNISEAEIRRRDSLKQKLEKARIAEVPGLAEFVNVDDSTFDDLVQIHQMREFAAFEHTVTLVLSD